jgi:Bacterial Ig-like domain (group 3)
MSVRLWVATVVAIGAGALAPAAIANPIVVNVRVEGRSQTLFEGPVATYGHPVTSASGGTHQCDGTNNGANPSPGATNTTALADGLSTVGTSWDGSFDSAFDDYFITRIGPDAQTATQFWGDLDNYEFAPVSGCQQEVSPGDNVLWAFDAFNAAHFLKLTASSTTVAPGQAITVHVAAGESGVALSGAEVAPVSTDPVSDFETVETSDPSAVTTDGSGDATLSWSTPGWKRVKAVLSNSTRSNRLDICVTPCGTAPADTLVRGPAVTGIATAVDDAAKNAGWAGTETTGAQAYDTATLTASPTAGVPTGTVTYSYYTNATCTAPAQSTQAVTLNSDGSIPNSSPTAGLAGGSYSYQASYSGDATHLGATGACEPFTVIAAKASQTITVTSSPPSPATFGGSYTPAATGGASGNPVLFSIDSSSGAGVCSISNSGKVSLTGVGTCVLDANQAGNANYNAAAQAQQSFAVAKQPTASSLVASPSSALATQAVALTATVTPAPDGGTVAFDNGPTVIAGCGAVNVTGGTASCQTSSLPVGSDHITVVYSGDSHYQGSSSSPALTETVSPDTASNLAKLTLQYVESSTKFQALSPLQKKVIEALANLQIAVLGQITPHLPPAQLAKLISLYKQGVAGLHTQGWLTAAQASTLDGLAGNVQG